MTKLQMSDQDQRILDTTQPQIELSELLRASEALQRLDALIEREE